MADAINLRDIEPLFAAVTAEQEALVQDNDAHEKAIAQNNEKLLILRAKASAFQEVMNISPSLSLFDSATVTLVPSSGSSAPKESNKPRVYANRRMRLGAKKRVIYELVRMGVATFDAIYEAVKFSSLDIDHRYVREVFRSGKLDGDFVDGEGGSIVLTPEGIEIMDKAPKPMDWVHYETAMYAALAPDDEDRYRD
jgi:hypothetical protein